MPQPADAPPVRLRFAEAEVPCVPGAISDAYFALTLHARNDSGHHTRAFAARILAEAPADRADGGAAHRYLLGLRRQARREGPGVSQALNDSLVSIRRHSNLYTPRTCECARAALLAFEGELTAALRAANQTVENPGVRVWAATGAPQALRPVVGALDPNSLAPYLGFRGFDTGLLRWTQRPVIEVDITASADEATVTAARVQGHRRQEVTFARLDARRSDVTRFLIYNRPPMPQAATQVLSWPDAMVSLAANRVAARQTELFSAYIADVLAAGFLDRTPDEQRLIAHLDPSWAGSPAELVATAVSVLASRT